MPNFIKPEQELTEIENHLYSNLPQQAEAGYDQKAKVYEYLVSRNWYNKLLWGTRPKDYEAFAKWALLNPATPHLDIGCGGLSQTGHLYADFPGEAWLVDNSLSMLKIGKQRIPNQSLSFPAELHLLQADAFQLPFKDQTFAQLVSFGMLHLFDDKQAFIREALHVLQPGGCFYLTGLTADRWLSRQHMRLLQRQGEFGQGWSAREMVNLVQSEAGTLEHYTVGNMVFLYGQKWVLKS